MLRVARCPGFVQDNYSYTGSLRLHALALGGDLLRTPVNVVLAPLQVLMRLAGLGLRLCGLRRASGWLARRSLVMGTRVSREVEARILHDLLGLTKGSDDRNLARRIEDAPELRDWFRGLGGPEDVSARAKRTAMTLELYSGTRSAVSELTTAILTVILGAFVFQTLTPGMVSVAPRVADMMALEAALDGFPLGRGAGRLWYAVFPVSAGPGLIATIVIPLILLASFLTTFAGILADPMQAATGIHQRRLLRLIDAVEEDLTDRCERPFAGPEHYMARVFDVVDMGTGLFRHFR